MHGEKLYSVLTIKFLLTVCLNIIAIQNMASSGRFSARAIQESKCRIHYLNFADYSKQTKEELCKVITQEQLALVSQMYHRCLSIKYNQSEVITKNCKPIKDVMLEWSKSNPVAVEWTLRYALKHMRSLVQPGEHEKAMLFMRHCRTEVVIQYDRCQLFGQESLGEPLPKELSILTLEVVDKISKSWLQSAAPIDNKKAVDKYHKDCQQILKWHKNYEIQFGRKLM